MVRGYCRHKIKKTFISISNGDSNTSFYDYATIMHDYAKSESITKLTWKKQFVCGFILIL